jgi:hypothetical protein
MPGMRQHPVPAAAAAAAGATPVAALLQAHHASRPLLSSLLHLTLQYPFQHQ